MNFLDMYNKIYKYQCAMGYDPETLNQEARMEVMRQYVLALNVEQVEMLTLLPWAPWKKGPVNISGRVVEEWLDCLVFLLDQAVILDIQPKEIEHGFERTMKKLYERIDNGYSIKRERKENAK